MWVKSFSTYLPLENLLWPEFCKEYCIVTLFLFSDSGLSLLNGFDYYFDLFWMVWLWKPAILNSRIAQAISIWSGKCIILFSDDVLAVVNYHHCPCLISFFIMHWDDLLYNIMLKKAIKRHAKGGSCSLHYDINILIWTGMHMFGFQGCSGLPNLSSVVWYCCQSRPEESQITRERRSE